MIIKYKASQEESTGLLVYTRPEDSYVRFARTQTSATFFKSVKNTFLEKWILRRSIAL